MACSDLHVRLEVALGCEDAVPEACDPKRRASSTATAAVAVWRNCDSDLDPARAQANDSASPPTPPSWRSGGVERESHGRPSQEKEERPLPPLGRAITAAPASASSTRVRRPDTRWAARATAAPTTSEYRSPRARRPRASRGTAGARAGQPACTDPRSRRFDRCLHVRDRLRRGAAPLLEALRNASMMVGVVAASFFATLGVALIVVLVHWA